MELAFIYPVEAGLIAPTGWPSRSFSFGMGRMVTIKIAGEDLVRLAESLGDLGHELLEPGLAWLLREGATHFVRDQRTWDLLEAGTDPVSESVRLELQRREVAAHVFSMRARTLRTEVERDALEVRVEALRQEYEQLRSRLARLQWERRHLKAVLEDER